MRNSSVSTRSDITLNSAPAGLMFFHRQHMVTVNGMRQCATVVSGDCATLFFYHRQHVASVNGMRRRTTVVSGDGATLFLS
jgi:hypothetical protein